MPEKKSITVQIYVDAARLTTGDCAFVYRTQRPSMAFYIDEKMAKPLWTTEPRLGEQLLVKRGRSAMVILLRQDGLPEGAALASTANGYQFPNDVAQYIRANGWV